MVAPAEEGQFPLRSPGEKGGGTGFERFRRNVPPGVDAKSVSGTSSVSYLTFIDCFHACVNSFYTYQIKLINICFNIKLCLDSFNEHIYALSFLISSFQAFANQRVPGFVQGGRGKSRDVFF